MRKFFVLAAVAAFTFISVGAADAHVTVNPSSAPKGGFAKLTFRVPNEDDSANTTQLEVVFPDDAPLAFASVKPVPGWTYKVDKTKLATPIKSDDGEVTDVVAKITWSGGKIGPGEFQEFDVSVGPLPENKDSMTFKALQTYDNGEVVRWIDIASGSEEPEHPAPVLTLTAAASDHHATTSEDADSSKAKSSDGTARALGGAGLILGLAALGLAGTKRGKSS